MSIKEGVVLSPFFLDPRRRIGGYSITGLGIKVSPTEPMTPILHRNRSIGSIYLLAGMTSTTNRNRLTSWATNAVA
jgi:hypothetical protein